MLVLLQAALTNGILAGLMALMVLVLARWLHSPRIVRMLWLVVLLRLIMPPVWSLPISSTILLDKDWLSHVEIAWLLMAWTAGTVTVVLISFFRVGRSWLDVRRTSEATPALTDEVISLAKRLSFRPCTELRLSEEARPPFSLRVPRRAIIIFPAGLVPRLDITERATLLAREFYWLRWRVTALHLFSFAIVALFWWFPLAWLARQRLLAASEECCDRWVTEALSGYSVAYAGALVEMADYLAGPQAETGRARGHAIDPSRLERRLARILQGPSPATSRLSGLALVASLLLLLPLSPYLTLPDLPEGETDSPVVVVDPPPGSYEPVKAERSWQGEEPDRLGKLVRTLQGVTSREVQALALSPGEDTLAVLYGGLRNREMTLTLFRMDTLEEIHTFIEEELLRSIAFAPDGSILATGTGSGKLQIRDPKTGKIRETITLGESSVTALSFLRDGESILAATALGTIVGWDLRAKKRLANLAGHKEAALNLALSGEGKFLLSGSRDNTARLWEVSSKKTVHVFFGHTSWVQTCALHIKNSLLATAGKDSLIKLWDARTGSLVRDLVGHTGAVHGLRFHPVSETLFSCGEDRTVRIWDITTGILLFTIDTTHAETITSMELTRDGEWMLTGSQDGTIKVWDLGNHQLTDTLRPKRYNPELNYPVLSLANSPDGKWLAVAGEERSIKILDAATGTIAHLLEGHSDIIARVAFSPDGKTLASAGFDGTVRLWDLQSNQARHTLRDHTSWVFSVAFSPDGRRLASGGYDGTVRIWESATGKLLTTLDKHRGSVRTVVFSPDGRWLASAGAGRTVRIWDGETFAPVRTLRGHEDTIRDLVFPGGSDRLASCSEDRSLRLWEVRTGQQRAAHTLTGPGRALIRTPQGQHLIAVDATRSIDLLDADSLILQSRVLNNRVSEDRNETTALALSPEANELYVGSLDRSIGVWRLRRSPRQPWTTFHTGGQPARIAAFSPEGQRLALSLEVGQLSVVDGRYGRVKRICESTPSAILQAALSPDGKTLATGCLDGTVRLYGYPEGIELGSLEGFKERVWSIAFSPGGKRLVAASGSRENADEPGEVRVFDLATKKVLVELQGIEAAAQAVAWSPDGKWIATGSRDGRARLSDAATGRCVHVLKAQEETADLRGVCFSPDSRFLLTSSSAGVARIWHITSGKQVTAFPEEKVAIEGVAWSPDGKFLATTVARGKGVVKVWTVSSEGEQLVVLPHRTLQGHRGQVRCVRFSSDSRSLVTGGGIPTEMGETIVWEVKTGQRRLTVQGHQRLVESALMTPDGLGLITAGGMTGAPGELYFWDLTQERNWKVNRAHDGAITCACWSPDGTILTTGGEDGSLRLWDGVTGVSRGTLAPGHRKSLRALCFRPDGRLLASSAEDGTVKVWDLRTNKEIAELTRHRYPVSGLSFSHDGLKLAVASASSQEESLRGEVQVLAVDTGKEQRDAEWTRQGATSVTFLHQDQYLVTGINADPALQIHEIATGTLHRAIPKTGSVESLVVSRDGDWLATAHGQESQQGEGRIRVWDTKTWKQRCSLVGHTEEVLALSACSNSPFLASASRDGTVHIWRIDAPDRSGSPSPTQRTR